MAVEPHAVIRASQACRGTVPDDAYLYATVDDMTLTKLSRIELKSNGRVQLYFCKDGHRRQLTVEGDELLVISFQELSGQNMAIILRQARHAASPFRGFGAPARATAMEPHATFVLAAMHGSNFFG
jgi:hypothetical protein